jgi:ubiquinone/menaquinone biosynthesis C-methylase UbiE
MRASAWKILCAGGFYAAILAWILAPAFALLGEPAWAGGCVAFALAVHLAGRTLSRVSPMPMPYLLRGVLRVPRGPQSPRRLNQLLQPCPGEHILEVGPGVGVHALPVAEVLLPDGVLDVLDVQQDMLDDLMRRAIRRDLSNIVPRLGDAQALPYTDGAFDAAYAIWVLGEIPDSRAALRELRRVLKPSGRLVICEVFVDPDYVAVQDLKDMAGSAGFVLERLVGPRFAYSALFRSAPGPGLSVSAERVA